MVSPEDFNVDQEKQLGNNSKKQAELSIAQRLKKAREDKGISLEEVEEQTNIRCKYLEAMEEEKFSLLPGESYTRIFLSSYAQYLGIDDKKLLRDYRIAYFNEETEKSLPLEQKSLQEKQKRKPVLLSKKVSLPNKSLPIRKSYLFISVTVLVVVLLAVWMVQRNKAINPYGQAQLPSVEQSQEQGPPSTGDISHENVTEPAFKGAEVQVEFTGECWVKVQEDERVVFTGLLKAGAKKTWKGMNYVKIRFGNAGTARVIVNGKDQGVVGKSGETTDKIYRAND